MNGPGTSALRYTALPPLPPFLNASPGRLLILLLCTAPCAALFRPAFLPSLRAASGAGIELMATMYGADTIVTIVEAGSLPRRKFYYLTFFL